MYIFNFGVIDKKLLIIIVISIVTTIDLVMKNKLPKHFNIVLYIMEEDVGPLIVGIITYFIFNRKKEKVKKNKKNYKSLIILGAIQAIKAAYDTLYNYFILDDCYYYNIILNTINGVEIFLVTIETFILLKYRYYNHHIISMILFLLLGIGNDILLENFTILEYNYLYIYIIYIINEVFMLCYLKYMMDKLYYHYTEVLILYGLFGTIYKIIIYGSLLIYEYKNDITDIIDYFKYTFDNSSVAGIIFIQFLFYLLSRGINLLLLVLILYYLRPNHIIITDEISIYINILFFEEKPNKYYSIIIFAFQLLSLSIYFEIFELNFLGLNKNTVKNIKHREITESERKSNLSDIELNDQYLLRNDRKSGGSDDGIDETPNSNKDELLIDNNDKNKKKNELEEFSINNI